jgi:hypothetical protein
MKSKNLIEMIGLTTGVGMKTVGNGIYSVISFFFDCE